RAGAGEAGSPVLERYRAAAAAAIEEVMSASAASVERLAAGLAPVRVISDQVHALANRATVVALEAALGAGREAGPPAPADPSDRPAPSRRAAELRRLAAEIQSLTTRTGELAREVDQQAAAAIERVRGLRARARPARAAERIHTRGGAGVRCRPRADHEADGPRARD